MKRKCALLVMAWCLTAGIADAGGIFGTGTTSEDSIAISVHITDSLGNPSGTHADSFFVAVVGPSGDSLTGIAGVASTPGLDIDSMETGIAGWVYVYSDAISAIDGEGRSGTYELTFCAKDNSPEYINCVRRTFQIVSTNLGQQLASITTILDSVLAVLDTVQSQDDWVSAFDPAADTAICDAVKLSGDLDAADNLETMLDGTSGGKLTLGGLEIRSQDNDTAMVVQASPTGTGLGLYLIGGGNGGEGVKIVGGNMSSAMVAQAGSTVGSTHGFDLIGDGGGFGLNGSFSTSTRSAIADAVWDEDTTGHGTSSSFAVMLKDTSAYQGGGSSLTASEVADSVWGHLLDTAWADGSFGDSASGWGATAASSLDSGVIQRISNRQLDSTQNAFVADLSDAAVDAVWDESQSGHITEGTFGSYLDDRISDIGSPYGDGIYPVTICAYDTAGSQPVPGVRLSVFNEGLETLIAQGVTGGDGREAFNLDSGLYVLSSFAPGYLFAAYDTMEIAGPTADTTFGSRFDPGSPSAPDLCRVYGFIYGVDGQPLQEVTVTAELVGGVVRYGSTIVSPFKRTVASDSVGYFYFDLIPSDDINPAGTQYRIGATYSAGTIINQQVTVPQTTSWLLSW